MSRYRVTGHAMVPLQVEVEVEAASEGEAQEKALREFNQADYQKRRQLIVSNSVAEDEAHDFRPSEAILLAPRYSVDDRGNVAQFYDGDEVIATLDREAGPKADQSTWDGTERVTAWAVANGYPEVATLPREVEP